MKVRGATRPAADSSWYVPSKEEFNTFSEHTRTLTFRSTLHSEQFVRIDVSFSAKSAMIYLIYLYKKGYINSSYTPSNDRVRILRRPRKVEGVSTLLKQERANPVDQGSMTGIGIKEVYQFNQEEINSMTLIEFKGLCHLSWRPSPCST